MKFKLGILLLVLFLSGCTRPGLPAATVSPTAKFADRQLIMAQLGPREVQLEVVSSPSSITQGLSGRETLGSDGMLFVLPTTTTPQFWMKEMKFDLDLIWIKENTVIDITANVPHPAPGTNLQDLPLYSPPESVDMVLELEAGKAAEWGLSPGARLQVK